MRVGVQLRPWLIQEPPPTLETVLAEAAAAGYDSIEIGAHYLDWEHPEILRAMLDRQGLGISGVHVGGDIFNPENVKRVRSKISQVCACVAGLGAHYLLYSGLLIEQKSAAELASEVEAINLAAAECGRFGLSLLYHNHWWEIANTFADLHHYSTHTDPGLVSFCLDLGWVQRAGGDPFQAIDLLGSRAPYFHLRDDTPQKRWETLGQGVIDFPKLLGKIAPLQPAWVVVEQDDIIGSVKDAVAVSRKYLRGIDA